MTTKTVFISGIAGGISKATAEIFNSHGYKVIGLDLQIPNGDYVDDFFQGDVNDEKLWQQIHDFIEIKYGKLDALVNIAGRNYYERIENSDLDIWRKMFDVNVIGMVASIKYLVPLLKVANAPAIVNMSSISAEIGSIGYASYCASKGAIDSLTKSLALELAPKIRVNAVAPGWIETEFTMNGLRLAEDPVAYKLEVEQMHALGRVGKPEEIAKAIYWLSSSEASFMTGSILVVDGGYLIKN